jgi:nicotinamidase/pyrazinamidase
MRYDPSTALVVVDVQNDFAHPDGSLAVRGGEAVVDRVNQELERASDAGAVIATTQDWHPADTPHFEKDGGTWPVHCVGGTWGAELHPGLRVPDGAIAVRKGTGGEDGYSGFTVRDPTSGETAATSLEAELRSRGVRSVVVVGIATDVCVAATARDALDLGFATTVIADATAPVDLEPGDGDRALAELAVAGADIG